MKIMNVKSLILIITLIFFYGFKAAYSQVPNPSNIDVKSMSDSQIKKVKQNIEKRGLSQQQAIDLARQQGATESQIQEMIRRFQQLEVDATDSISSQYQSNSGSEQLKLNDLSYRRAPIDTSNHIFGSSLFNSENLTFEPSVTVQTPKNYIIGIGDQLNINVWGGSQDTYQVTVNNDGQIMINDLGPIYIAGMTYDEATRKIKERLSLIYKDMRGEHPNTFAQINMGQLRSIQINVVGEINTPGTYTLPVTSTVFNALYLSGGPTKKGSFRNIKVIRDDKIFKDIDIYEYLINADASNNIQLQDEDVIYVPTYTTLVSVKNGFKRSGMFEMKKEEHLNDIISFAGGFKDDASLNSIQLNRKTQQGLAIIDVDFKDINLTTLVNGDILSAGKIKSIYKNRVVIAGAVFSPGEYECSEGLMLSKLILKADSITPGAFLNRATIIRLNPDSTTYNIPFNVESILNGRSDIALQPEDSVIIKSYNDLRETEKITVRGEVLKPGVYPYHQNMTLEDVVFMAGGLKESSDTTYIEVARRLSYEEAADLNDTLAHIYSFSINRKLEIKGNNPGFTLRPYDEIYFRRAPGFRESGSVSVKGEVKFEGSYALQTNTYRISDLLKKTGGFTPQAYIKGASLTRFTEEMGRETVGIDMNELLKRPGSNSDLILQPGDQITIPKESQTVKIAGNVQNQISATYIKGKNLKYYIGQAGGYKERTRKSKVYVVYANGTSASTHQTFFFINLTPKVEPGSKIVAPEKPEKKEGEATKWISMASALSSLSIAIVTLVNISK